MFAEDHCTMQHPWNVQVVRKGPFPERLLEATIAGGRIANSKAVFFTVAFCILSVCERRITDHPEFFTKIGVTPRLLAGKSFPRFPNLSSCLNGIDDSCVTCAAAEVATERLCDSTAILGTALPQQARGADDNSRNTKTALDSAFQNKGLSQHISHIFR